MIKHLFLVHSHITWLITQSIIQFKKLSSKDIVIIRARNYKIDKSEYKVIEFPLFCNLPEHDYTRLDFNNQEHISEIHTWNKKLSEKIQGNFYAYVPYTSNRTMSLVVSNKDCMGYYYIEEGAKSYINTLSKSKKIKLREFLKLWLKLKNRHLASLHLASNVFNYKHKKFKGAFSYSNECFQGSLNKKVFDIRLLKTIYPVVPKTDFQCIIVFDAISIFGLISMKEHMNIIESVIFPLLKEKGFTRVAIKLHPEHYLPKGKQEAERIIDMFNLNREIKTNIMDVNFMLETYLLHHSIPIITFVSSLSIYAGMLENKVYSLRKRLTIENYPRINLPDNILRNFEYI